MNEDRWQQIKRIYNSALECDSDKREGFLREACGGDDSLRKEVEVLLVHQREAEGFMEAPAMEVAAQVMAKDQRITDIDSPRSQSVAHYRIVEKIGEGGMGVVYRAEDTRLDRHVAIKSLPDIFLADPSRLARFEREAKILAALNHANIASVYGLEESEGKRFLVLELVEGKTLTERLKKGRIPLDETLEICHQIAAGLEAAHEKGIIHRDLKPSNIKRTPEGKVKILDFGLAKALESQGASPTDISTETGSILGTAAYMSPEQAKGRPVDKRADVWAFGCILFECLTGKRAFPGEMMSETLAGVIKEEPAWDSLPSGTPEKVRDLLKRCLRKDPQHRLRDIGDAQLEIEESRSPALTPDSRTVLHHRRMIAAAGTAIVSIILIATGWLFLSRSRPAKEVPLTIVPLITYPGTTGSPTFSPDGNDIAFSWNGEKQDNTDIYRKMIGRGQSLQLTSDPAPDILPAWSPDGRHIAFLRYLDRGRYGVFLLPPLGGSGSEQKLVETRAHGSLSMLGAPCLGLAWSQDSRWLVTTDRNGPEQQSSSQPGAKPAYGLHLLSVETGEKRGLTSPPPEIGDQGAVFAPDGRTLAFVRVLDFDRSVIYRLHLTDELWPKGEPERLESVNRRVYGVVWTRDGKDVLYSSGNHQSGESFVRRIRLSEPKSGGAYRITQESFGESARSLAISANGSRLAYSRSTRDSDIYRFELPGKAGRLKAPERFITSRRMEAAADFSPDGRSIAFHSTRSGSEEIWICNADGSNPRQLTSMNGPQTGNARWSPDGKTIVFDSRKEGSADLYLINPDGSSLRRLTSDPGFEGHASWSRDGKWIYFYSNHTGRRETYKMPAGGGPAIQVTKNGGASALESPDGKWIYFSKMIEGRGIAIWKVAAGGGEESEVHPGPLSYFADFLLLEEGIYLTKAHSLDFFDFASGKSRSMIQDKNFFQVGSTILLGLTISPDHRYILFTKWEPPTGDLMLVENFR